LTTLTVSVAKRSGRPSRPAPVASRSGAKRPSSTSGKCRARAVSSCLPPAQGLDVLDAGLAEARGDFIVSQQPVLLLLGFSQHRYTRSRRAASAMAEAASSSLPSSSALPRSGPARSHRALHPPRPDRRPRGRQPGVVAVEVPYKPNAPRTMRCGFPGGRAAAAGSPPPASPSGVLHDFRRPERSGNDATRRSIARCHFVSSSGSSTGAARSASGCSSAG